MPPPPDPESVADRPGPPESSEGAGVAERSGRGVLAFRGDQALWFCDQLLSNQVVNLPAGSGIEALLLTPHGKITAALRLLQPAAGEVLADFEDPAGDRGAVFSAFFGGRIFATRVTVEDEAGRWGLLSVLGPAAGAIVSAAAAVSLDEMPGPEEHATVALDAPWGRSVLARVARPAAGLDLLVPRPSAAAALEALRGAGAAPLTEEAYEDLRVRAGLARDGVDFTDAYLPQEAALERAVHFEKGCYLGQEAVAMTQRGRVRRRLRHLRFEGEAVPGPVEATGPDGAEEVGQVTSATNALPGYGIATVRTSVALGAAVAVAGRAAVVEELPGTVAGPALPSARELREALGK